MQRAAKTLTALAALAACALASAENAAEPMTRAQLVSPASAIVPGASFEVAVEFTMNPGVHIYWRNPGESGMPPRIQWLLPPGFRAEPMRWPYPKRFTTDGLVSFGYEGKVMLLSRIHAPEALRPGMRIMLRARADWLSCKEICVPEGADLRMALAVRERSSSPTAHADDVAKAHRLLPSAGQGWQFSAVRAQSRAALLRIVSTDGAAIRDRALHFYPYAEGVFSASAKQVVAFENTYTARLQIPLAENRDTVPERLEGVLVVGEGRPDAYAVQVAADLSTSETP